MKILHVNKSASTDSLRRGANLWDVQTRVDVTRKAVKEFRIWNRFFGLSMVIFAIISLHNNTFKALKFLFWRRIQTKSLKNASDCLILQVLTRIKWSLHLIHVHPHTEGKETSTWTYRALQQLFTFKVQIMIKHATTWSWSGAAGEACRCERVGVSLTLNDLQTGLQHLHSDASV